MSIYNMSILMSDMKKWIKATLETRRQYYIMLIRIYDRCGYHIIGSIGILINKLAFIVWAVVVAYGVFRRRTARRRFRRGENRFSASRISFCVPDCIEFLGNSQHIIVFVSPAAAIDLFTLKYFEGAVHAQALVYYNIILMYYDPLHHHPKKGLLSWW